jgi:hypothetical protein
MSDLSSNAVSEAMYKTWQAREISVAHVTTDEIPSHRIARIAIDSISQVRRLLGMRIVAGCGRDWGSSAQRRWRSGTLSYFRKTEVGHLPSVAAGGGVGCERVTVLF